MDLLPPVVDLGLLTAAVVLHEVGHGVVAYGCGDGTAAEQGRLTLNPLRHIDPVGTILVPVLLALSSWAVGGRPLLFGWAKPVPVDVRRLRNPRRDMALVALAGPSVNLSLAALSAIAYAQVAAVTDVRHSMAAFVAGTALSLNCVLAVLNLLPIPPLDGGRVLMAILPRRFALVLARVERVGLLAILLLLSTTSLLPTLVYPVLRFLLAVGSATTPGAG